MNHLSLLLLVDSDRHGLDALTYGFEREGCAVAGTVDASMAPELARTTTPQLAVISLREPDPSGLRLITGLRGQPSTKDLPVVTLGPASMRPAAMAAGASDFLSTPLYVRDVISVGKLMLLVRDAVASSPAENEIELQARLSEYYGLYYLIRAMSATNRSGILQLNRGNKKGEVRFSEGAVTSAHVGTLQAFPALHQLLLWEEAAISLKLRPVVRRSQFTLDAADLLQECERFMRDFAHAARDLGAPRTVYVATSGTPVPGAKRVPAEATPVLRLFDGRRTLADVIEESPFRVFDTLRVIKRILDAGALALQPGSAIRNDGAADGGPGNGIDPWMQRPSASLPATPPPVVPARPLRPSGAHAPAAAVSRPTPARLSSVPDQRAVGGDRRKSGRQRDLASGEPAARRTPAPIPLTVRKNSSEPAVIANVIPARKSLRTPPPAEALAIGTEPTIHMKLDAAFPRRATPMVAPLEAPVTAHVPQPAPVVIAAREPAPVAPVAAELPPAAAPEPAPAMTKTPPPQPQAKAPDSKTKLKKISSSHLTPTSAFNAIESDFFAREADLYKHNVVESFDDLDRGGTGRKMQPVRTPPPTTARKKR
ncbi:MAG TPA: DUF4388 domain-containing protein [Polyangia bacterium]|nr:DUF4388 domain-containing protein [Polyangia bacterium]